MRGSIAFDKFDCCERCNNRTWLYQAFGKSICDECIGAHVTAGAIDSSQEHELFPELGDEQLKSVCKNNKLAIAKLIAKYLKYCRTRGLNPLKGDHCEEMRQPLSYMIFNMYVSQSILNIREQGGVLGDLEINYVQSNSIRPSTRRPKIYNPSTKIRNRIRTN